DGVDDDGNTNSSLEVSPSESLGCRGEGRRGMKESDGTKRQRKTEREIVKDKDYQRTAGKRKGRTKRAERSRPIELVPPLRSLGVKF
ncbi:hypothetical protein ALC57_17626, partial [Trachymyrmex cornetzi]